MASDLASYGAVQRVNPATGQTQWFLPNQAIGNLDGGAVVNNANNWRLDNYDWNGTYGVSGVGEYVQGLLEKRNLDPGTNVTYDAGLDGVFLGGGPLSAIDGGTGPGSNFTTPLSLDQQGDKTNTNIVDFAKGILQSPIGVAAGAAIAPELMAATGLSGPVASGSIEATRALATGSTPSEAAVSGLTSGATGAALGAAGGDGAGSPDEPLGAGLQVRPSAITPTFANEVGGPSVGGGDLGAGLQGGTLGVGTGGFTGGDAAATASPAATDSFGGTFTAGGTAPADIPTGGSESIPVGAGAAAAPAGGTHVVAPTTVPVEQLGAGLRLPGAASLAPQLSASPSAPTDFGSGGGLAVGALTGAGDTSGAFTGDGSMSGGDNSDYGTTTDDSVAAARARITSDTGLSQQLLDKIMGVSPTTALAAAAIGGTLLSSRNAAAKNKDTASQLNALGADTKATAAKASTDVSNIAAGAKSDVAAATAPISSTANSLIEQYKNGTINPSDQFAIDKWKAAQIAATKNYYAKAGISDSSSERNAEAQIEAQAVAMQDKARQGLLTQGLSALGLNLSGVNLGLSADQLAVQGATLPLTGSQLANQSLTTAITASAQQDQQFQAAQQSALNSLLLLSAMRSNPGASVTA